MTYPQISLESIIAHNPDVIIELMPEVPVTEALERRMRDRWSQMQSIPAVANGRVFFMTDDNCLIPSLRYVEIIEKVSRILHPEHRVDE